MTFDATTKEGRKQVRKRARQPRQASFVFRTWGGKRAGAGRKRRPERAALQAHAARPAFDRLVPVHVTLRAVSGLQSFRSEVVRTMIRSEIARGSAKGCRVIHFSIQTNHLHLVVEAGDAIALSRGMQRLASRIARRLNILLQRRGAIWRERYHRRDLASPRQVRNALVYVLFNDRKHAPSTLRQRRVANGELDEACSSVVWAASWTASKEDIARILAAREGPPPVARPETYLAKVAWKRHGGLRVDEVPVTPS